MKQRILVVLLACAAISVSSPCTARAQVGISANVDIQIGAPSDFYQPLESSGTWVDVPQYGRCWQPRGVEADWQPYTVGHWEWTDAGWYWASDESWGWACYHYGSWNQRDARYGWCWIPGTELGARVGDLAVQRCLHWLGAVRTWSSSAGSVVLHVLRCASLSRSFRSAESDCEQYDNHQSHEGGERFPTANGRFQRPPTDDLCQSRSGSGIRSAKRRPGRPSRRDRSRDVVRDSHQPEVIRHDNNQRPEARPEQRPAEQPRHDATPAPTGREEQRKSISRFSWNNARLNAR